MNELNGSAPVGYEKPITNSDEIKDHANGVLQHIAIQQHLLGENHPLDCSARIPVDPGFFGAVFIEKPPIFVEKDKSLTKLEEIQEMKEEIKNKTLK